MLIYLKDKFSSNGKTSFNRSELNKILSVYGIRVQKGDWKDYAIDSMRGRAIFSIFRSTHELPLYSIIKVANKSKLKPSSYMILSGNEILKQTSSLDDIIDFLEEQ